MAVLAASICTRGGKPLLLRQFRDISTDRITALLANFPSLISDAGSQHTTVEDDEVRYVYQPVEELYVVLITNKSLNILQDIDTLHLFVLTVLTMLRLVDEREVFDLAFEILLAFDEIINLGYKENLTLSQVQQFLEMDSHEEKIQEIIERNKELEAAEERKRKAKEIQRRELAKRNTEAHMMAAGAFGSGSGSGLADYGSYQQPTYQLAPIVDPAVPLPAPVSKFAARGPTKGGLQLGKKPKSSHAHLGLGAPEAREPLLAPREPVFNSAAASATPEPASRLLPAPQAAKSGHGGILLTVNEKILATIGRDGLVQALELKGDLQLRISNPEYARAKVLLGPTALAVQYKTHPNVDKATFTSQQVILSKEFPLNDRLIGVLRWRAVGKADDTSLVPVVLMAWVSIDGDAAHVTLEWEAQGTLPFGAQVLVPVEPHGVELLLDLGVRFDPTESGVLFTMPQLDAENAQGLFEFTVAGVTDEDELFPMQVALDLTLDTATEQDVSVGGVSVVDVVTNNEDEALLPFDLHLHLTADNFQVV